ncbi:MAG: hypothetical protein EPO65_10270 [Dehalococcoidia bacterium]|nr:MAG: hypothetical protein EPO65_10270 [Dehalococcoidia bacterium]
MHTHRPALVTLIALVGVLIALLLALLPREADAASIGLRMPAPAGTQWKAASGYNTATHLGVDPYALDLVRADGVPTAGTVVLAPISGTLGGGGTSQDCAWIRTPDVTVLICHIITDSTAVRNATVVQGQRLGVVAPEGQKGNNGLPHIHLAVNRGGSSGTSLPFDGDYLLDGVAFPATTAPNAYSGAPVVTSTNAAAPATPIVVAASLRGRIVSGVVQTQGLGLVMFGGGSNAELVNAAACGSTSATFWVTIGGRFVGYIPAALVPQVNAEWDATFPGGIPANTPMLVRCR